MTTWLFGPVHHDDPREVLDITLRFDGDVTVCRLEGPLCAYTAPVLDAWLDQLHRNGRHRVVVDAGGLDSLSGDGVDVLLDHAARLAATGGCLRVRRTSIAARQVLRLCGAEHLVEDPAPTRG